MLYQLSYLGEPLFFNNGNILADFRIYVKPFIIFMTSYPGSVRVRVPVPLHTDLTGSRCGIRHQ